MDELTSLIVGHAAGKLIDKASDLFHRNVVERWSKWRAQCFFEEFCREVKLEFAAKGEGRLDLHLERLLTDDSCTEVLYDAYRRVSFAKSKTLGPRVIGILTAKILNENRVASDAEAAMLEAAETLFDHELLAFATFVREQRQVASEHEQTNQVKLVALDDLRIEWCKEEEDSNWSRGRSRPIGPLNFHQALGSWAAKIESIGIMNSDTTQEVRKYFADDERHVDMDGIVKTTTWWISIPSAYIKFAEYIDRVKTESPP